MQARFLKDYFVPNHLPEAAAAFLDNAFAVIPAFHGEIKRAMLKLLLVKYLFSLRPHSKFSSPGAFNQPFAEGRFDDIKATYKHAIAANGEHPLPALRRLAAQINRGVMRGAQPCSVHKGDAAETIRQGEGAEILYLDPPYAGTLKYEKEYRLLDQLFGDELPPSPFSQDSGAMALAGLLERAQSFPLWVISYGNAVLDIEAMKALIGRIRPVRAVELAYTHLGAVASEEKKAKNREFILLAGEGVKC